MHRLDNKTDDCEESREPKIYTIKLEISFKWKKFADVFLFSQKITSTPSTGRCDFSKIGVFYYRTIFEWKGNEQKRKGLVNAANPFAKNEWLFQVWYGRVNYPIKILFGWGKTMRAVVQKLCRSTLFKCFSTKNDS